MSSESINNNENSQQELLEKFNSNDEMKNSLHLTPLKESKQTNVKKQHAPLPLSLKESNSNSNGLSNISNSYINTKPTAAQSPDFQRLSFIQQQQQISPLNHSNLFNNSINTSHSMNISPQVERSMRLTTELKSLVNDLDLIYNEIGLSAKEIQQKEADIFRNLSDTIRSFSVKAQQEKQNISKQNTQILDCLKTILYKIGDSKGTYTINDLYIRNMIILSQHDLSPSKRDMSLLSKRRILMQGAEFVFEVFDKILNEYLKDCLEFTELKTLNNENKQENDEEYKELGLLTADECYKLKELLKDSNKLSKCFFDNVFNKESFPYKILNYTDLQSYNHSSYNKITSSEKKENTLKKRINEINLDYFNKKELLITNLKEISKYCNFLQLTIPQDFYRFNNDNFSKYEDLLTKYLYNIPSLTDKIPIYDDFLQVVSNLLTSVSQYKLERMQLNDDLTNQVKNLWNKLKIEQFEIDSFESKLVTDFTVPGNVLSIDQIELLKKELNRLKVLRKTSIKQIIEEDWQRINELWDTMRFPESERAPFKTFFENKKMEIQNKEELSNNSSILYDENEILLNRCEDEINLLEEKHKVFEPLLKNIDLYETFLNEKLELDESSKNPGRLTSRDSHKILLREEKIRKRISRYFPSVVNNLSNQLQEFQDNFQRPFLKETGEDYLQIILKEKETLAIKYPRSRVAMMQQQQQQMTKDFANRKLNNANGESQQTTIHRQPASTIANRGIRERNKRILNNAAKSQSAITLTKRQSLPLENRSSNSNTRSQLTSARLGRLDSKPLIPKTESLPHSRMSSRNSNSSLLNSRANSRSISNKSENSVKAEVFDLNEKTARLNKTNTVLKTHNRVSSPDRLFKRYERNSRLLKRPLSPEKIDINEYSFKKVRISRNDQVINKSLDKSISLMNESLSPIKPTSFIKNSLEKLSNSSSPMNILLPKTNVSTKNTSISNNNTTTTETSNNNNNNSLNDDVDMAEDIKFDLWQQKQLAKIGSTVESQQLQSPEHNNKIVNDQSELGIAINDTSNF